MDRIGAVTKLMTQCWVEEGGWPEVIERGDIASAGGIILSELEAIQGVLHVYGDKG